MVAVKLEHSNLAKHQAGIFKQLQIFRKEGQLCDVVLKSCDGTEHQAHTAVLCAASADLKNMLVGPFLEAHQVQQGQPVQMAASEAVVLALLEYIYGDQPLVELDDSLGLLRLADAYNFPELAASIEAGLHACLDSVSVGTALKVLQQTQYLPELKIACEKKVAANFESCIEIAEFLELSASQLGRILRSEDLTVSREEVVMKGLLNWLGKSKDRGVHLGLLLHHVDLQSLSSENLARLRHFSGSLGPIGHDLQTEVGEALQAQKKRSAAATPDAFRPKRRCLQHWSPGLGASSQAPQKVFPPALSMCCHDGAIYYADTYARSIRRWKLGERESQAVAGRGARVNGVNDLGRFCKVSVSPEGEMFVADIENSRLLSFANGFGNLVLRDVTVQSVFCSPSGDIYVLARGGRAVERLVSATRHPVASSEHLPAELRFRAYDLFVTKDEVIYFLDISDQANNRVLRIKPGEAEPVVVGEAPNKEKSRLQGLFVTEDEKVYIADSGQQTVWAFHPGDAAWTEVLTCPGDLKPFDVLVQGRSLYVSMTRHGAGDSAGSYEYLLPPDFQLG